MALVATVISKGNRSSLTSDNTTLLHACMCKMLFDLSLVHYFKSVLVGAEQIILFFQPTILLTVYSKKVSLLFQSVLALSPSYYS